MKSLRDPQRPPTHPGAILREDVLPALRITQTEFARLLGVSRLTVSELVNEKRAMSPSMAVRLEILLNTSAETWLKMQQSRDLWEARRESTGIAVKPLPARYLAALDMQE
ncbi:HigA family addiction module antitoxin [Massilia cavernae]|uniref:Addiction module antidote protein, HigA family n=1 Tax=Massilia cavernae TaxID=2320864 RepID=A0A418Y0Y9_9BURK|nr:HigA family addiction module antitoxin [Massilia cavernae]RJG19090.1 addiction module antidote protein, HigA family [Massilia cavernae]